MRAPIRADMHASTPQGGNTKPSSISEHRKMFENNTAAPKHDTSSNLPSSSNKTAAGKFGKKFGTPSSIAAPEKPVQRPVSPKLPVKPAYMKGENASPQLPPRSQVPGKVTTTAQQPVDYEEDVKLDNIPAHLRDRFEKARQRKTSKSGEGDTSPELRQLREEKQLKLDKKGFKPPPLPSVDSSDKPETGGTSIKDRMKMFSTSSTEEEPVKSPRWGGSLKKAGNPALSKPSVDYKAKTLPPSPKPQVNINNAPALPSRHELPPTRMDDSSAPPLPDRNTKPSRFGAKQPSVSPTIGKRPPMPAPVPCAPIDVSDHSVVVCILRISVCNH